MSVLVVTGSNTSTPNRCAPAYGPASTRSVTDRVRVGGATLSTRSRGRPGRPWRPPLQALGRARVGPAGAPGPCRCPVGTRTGRRDGVSSRRAAPAAASRRASPPRTGPRRRGPTGDRIGRRPEHFGCVARNASARSRAVGLQARRQRSTALSDRGRWPGRRRRRSCRAPSSAVVPASQSATAGTSGQVMLARRAQVVDVGPAPGSSEDRDEQGPDRWRRPGTRSPDGRGARSTPSPGRPSSAAPAAGPPGRPPRALRPCGRGRCHLGAGGRPDACAQDGAMTPRHPACQLARQPAPQPPGGGVADSSLPPARAPARGPRSSGACASRDNQGVRIPVRRRRGQASAPLGDESAARRGPRNLEADPR